MAQTNAITTTQVCTALDQEMIENFAGEYDRLEEILGLFPAETVAAGTALYQYKITGALNATVPAEGESTPLSQYTVRKSFADELGIKRHAKQTTAEAILKSGFENAIVKTDKKMLSHLRKLVLGDFFTALNRGTGALPSGTTAATLQAAIAQADAVLADALETAGDEASGIVHFVNPFDIADYLAAKDVTTQTLFGMTYLESFLGVENILVTNNVAKGKVIVTPVDNIHVRGIDFASLGESGLSYETEARGLIGVHHVPDYDRGSADTYTMVGANFMPEILNYIVKADITAAAADSGESADSGE